MYAYTLMNIGLINFFILQCVFVSIQYIVVIKVTRFSLDIFSNGYIVYMAHKITTS